MTYKPKSDFLQVMQERGFMADCTDLEGLDDALTKGVVTAYIGFDATANSLHIGNMLQLMMLRWFQKTGHRPITLMGGGTTKIGDPSGKDASRQMLTAEKINDNIKSIRGALEKYLTYDQSENGAILANNADWLDHLNYIDFLRDYGPHFTINRMLSFDSVKLRLDREQPLTFLEFNYMLLQAYDYMELNNRYDCMLQLGGSDQWGNIVNGVDLTRRINKKSVYGFTAPLITKSDGSKMGKSVNGAVWLNADQMSPYEFWQFWRNTDDADVGKFMKLFTEISVEECDRLGALDGSEINNAKIILADAVTTLAHGAEAAAAARATAREVFEKGGVGAELPTITLPASEIGDGISIVQLFVKTGLSKSGKDAKRLIAEGGAKLNDEAVAEAGTMVSADMIKASVKLSAGKKRHALVKLG